MSFKSITRLLKAFLVIIPVIVLYMLLYLILIIIELDPAISIIVVVLIVATLIVFLLKGEKKIINQVLIKKVFEFFDTLDSKEMFDIYRFYMRKAKRAQIVYEKAKHIYKAFITHDYISSDPYEYIDEIMAVESAYEDTFYFNVIVIREILFYNLMENGQIEQAMEMIQKNLDYIERMVDENQVPQEMQELVLNASSLYRHIIRFIKSPNERTAYAILKNEKGTNFDIVKSYYVIVRMFIENDMYDEAKKAIEKIKDKQGDYRLLVRLREYYTEL